MLFVKPERTPAFDAGSRVRVKSKDSIGQLIQPNCKTDGCLFTEQMWDYCGNVYPVLRVVESFFDERKKRSFKPRSPIYILQDLICDGNSEYHQQKCDHGCFLIWHEDWLDKV
jgi:hypothetical protein